MKERFQKEQKRGEDLEAALKEATTARSTAIEELHSAKESGDQQAQEVVTLRAVLIEEQERNAELEGQLQSEREQVKTLEEGLANKQGIVKDLEVAKEAHEKQVSMLEGRVKELEVALGSNVAEIQATLDGERERAVVEQQKLSAEFDTVTSEMDELKKATAEKEEQTNARMNALEESLAREQDRSKELDAALKKVEEDRTKHVGDIEKQVQTLVAELESANVKYQLACEEQERLVEEVLALEESLAIEQNHAEKLEVELTNALGVDA